MPFQVLHALSSERLDVDLSLVPLVAEEPDGAKAISIRLRDFDTGDLHELYYVDTPEDAADLFRELNEVYLRYVRDSGMYA